MDKTTILSFIFMVVTVIYCIVVTSQNCKGGKENRKLKKEREYIEKRNQKIDDENREKLETYMNNKINNIPQKENDKFNMFIVSDMKIDDFIYSLRLLNDQTEKQVNL